MGRRLEINIKEVSGHKDMKLIEIIGELDASCNSNEINQQIEPFIEQGYVNLIGDISKLNYIDSTGMLNLIIYCYMKTKRRGGNFKLFGANENIYEVLKGLGLTKIISIYETLDEALKNFSSND